MSVARGRKWLLGLKIRETLVAPPPISVPSVYVLWSCCYHKSSIKKLTTKESSFSQVITTNVERNYTYIHITVLTCWIWLWNQLLPPHHPHSHLHRQSTGVVSLALESDQLQQQDPPLPVSQRIFDKPQHNLFSPNNVKSGRSRKAAPVFFNLDPWFCVWEKQFF